MIADFPGCYSRLPIHGKDLHFVAQEPISNPLDIPRFCQETGLSVALDESLDEDDAVDVEKNLQMYACQGVVAVVTLSLLCS